MCGIAGHVGPTARELLPAMLGLLKHRGPDDSGIHAAGDVGLGMTRLAIIDLVTGRQPMSDATGRYWIVFNGEIYNFRQLRAELEAGGRRFRTQSDTEVILCHPAVARGLDWSAFHHYLAFGYTPATRSIFDEIRKLPPAHTATFVDGRLAQRRYWQLPVGAPSAGPRRTREESAAAVRAALREAVRLRLESDVPLGVFLSGGVDSSAVVASMREVTSGRIATFAVGLGRGAPTYDELPYARLVAQRFAAEAHREEIL